MTGAISCKKKDKPSCTPEDQTFAVRVLLQPTDQLNLDDDGEPLPTVVRLYQLKGDMNLQMIDFQQVWQDGGEAAFGDEYISEQQMTVYPGRPEVVEVEPDAQASHLLAVAIFREPMGQSWYRVWAMPKYHGHSVCAAQKQGKTWGDPCFYVLIDRNQVDGGHTAPAGFDREKVTIECPGPPLLNPPPPPKDEKTKKQEKREERKKKRKERLQRAQDAEVPEQPEGPSSPDAPSAPSAPEAPSAPGK